MIPPWIPTTLADSATEPIQRRCEVNSYGFKQMVNAADDEDICVGCDLPYTNRDGCMMCPACEKLTRGADFS